MEGDTIVTKLIVEMIRKLHHEKKSLVTSYVDALARHLPNIASLASAAHAGRLRLLCTSVESLYTRKKGRSKKSFLRSERRIKVRITPHEGDTTAISNTPEDRTVSDLVTGTLQGQLHNQIVTNDQLKGASAEVTNQDITLKHEPDSHQKQNDQTEPARVSLLVVALNVLKKVGEGSQKTDRRRLAEVAGSITVALEELLSSHGLCLKEVTVKDLSGKQHKLCYHETYGLLVQYNAKNPFRGSDATSYDNLCHSDRKIVEEIATLLDKSSCSNEGWQDFCATVEGLPSLQLVNSYREITRNVSKNV